MSTDVVVDTELYDDDIPKIEKVVRDLNEARLKPHGTPSSWHDEVVNRFAEAGYRANVVLYHVTGKENPDGSVETKDEVMTSITIMGRVDDIKVGEYDHERQGHQVRAKAAKGNHDGKSFFAIPGAAPGERRTASGLILPK